MDVRDKKVWVWVFMSWLYVTVSVILCARLVHSLCKNNFVNMLLCILYYVSSF
jgi:hypothetical protein